MCVKGVLCVCRGEHQCVRSGYVCVGCARSEYVCVGSGYVCVGVDICV